MTETQERFLRTVLGRVPLDSVVELHLFPAIRRGTLETGVAVIAAPVPAPPLVVVTDAAVTDEHSTDDHSTAEFITDDSVTGAAPQNLDDDSPYADEAPAPVASPRLRILTANYRHTVKGVERGKWTVDVQDEADAPLDAVEAVLRGVRHRSTEPADPELIPHDLLAALVVPMTVAPAA